MANYPIIQYFSLFFFVNFNYKNYISAMMILLQIFSFVLLILRVSSSGYIKDQISVKMATVFSNCVRLLNGTNTIGCQSNMKGNIGALVKIVEPKDVEEAIQKLPLGINDLIVLVETLDLSRELIDVIRTNEQVQGVILLDDKLKRPNKFSEDSSCPNQQFSAYKNDKTCHEWNAPGAIHPDGLRFLSFDKPIRFVYNQTEIELLVKKCANTYNKELKADGFRCVGRMTTFMLAAGNAQICKNRGESLYGLIESRTLCEPLSELNVFAMLPPLGQRSNKTVRADQFVLAARMDTFSTDYNSGNGDISVLTSIIALLSIANAIGTKMDEFLSLAKQRQLLFAFFHGESLGYIGSGRWLWDMEQGNFPQPPIKLPEEQVRQIGLDALSFFLEFQQIGTGEKLFLHTDKSIYASNRTQIDEILEALKNQVEFINPSKLEYGSMPPGSYHSVLSRTSHVPGMLLSSFGEGKYINNYVNSIYDTEIRWGNSTFYKSHVQRIKKAADVGLIAALSYVFNTTNQTVINQFKIKEEYVEELADCFFRYSRWECPLIMGVVNATNDAKMRKWLKYTANDLYIGTAGHHYSSIRVVLHSLLVNSLGQTGPTVNVANAQQCRDQNKKQNVYTYIWQNEPDTNTSKCYRTSIYKGQAQSPAFKIENYDFTNSTYPTWMESIQSGGSLELYFKADYHLELYALLIALFIIFISAPLNFGLKEQWFIDNTLPPASPQPL